MNYQFIKEPSKCEELAKRLRREKSFAYDTETTGLDPHTDSVILASFSTRSGETFLVDTRDHRCLAAFGDVFEDEQIKKVGFNLAFDYLLTKGTIGRDLEGCRDLYLAEIALTCGIQDFGRSLGDVTLKYLKKSRDKSLQKSFIRHKGDFSQSQLDYAAEDTADLFPIADIMWERIKSEGLAKTWEIENNAIPAFADIQFYGQRLDTEAWRVIMSDNKKLLLQSMDELDAFFAVAYDRVSQGEFSFAVSERPDRVDINYASVPQVLYGLQVMGIQIDGELIKDTGKDTMKKIRHLPVSIAMGKYRSAKRAIDAYGENFLRAIHPKTGRIHGKINQWHTGSGRPAGTGGINLLNIPRDKRYRHAFITDEDRLISTVDFAGAELRILADLSGDELMVKGFNSGIDFHCYVAAMLFNKEKVEKNDPLRTPTKELNFGLSYGMGPPKLCAKLNGNGYKITIEESQDLFNRYKATFKGAIAYLDSQKRIAKRDLVMTNCNGRKRHWNAPNPHAIRTKCEEELLKFTKQAHIRIEDEYQLGRMIADETKKQYSAIEREGANTQIQSVNVEWNKTSMYEMRKEFKKRQYAARMYNSVYDETVLDTPKSCAEDVHEIQKRIMIECGQRFTKKVPIEVEGHLMKCWTK
jgi:DNA polymerase-1